MYFHFREQKNKRSAGDNSNEMGTLKIEVPHWSAEVRIFDDLLNPVAPFERVQTDVKSASGYSTERELLPGAYQIQITLAGKTESEWAPVRPNRLTKVTTDAWNELVFTSAAPLKKITDSNSSQISQAEKMSRQLTWENSDGESRLFLFIRTPKPEKYADSFFKGLKLFDEKERLITDFSRNVKLNKKQGWLAFNAKLPSGGYILRRGRRGAILRSQVIYLCPDWQSEVFIQSHKYPTLGTMNFNMKKLEDSNSVQDAAEASEAILNYLRYKSDIRILLENCRLSNNLDKLLGGKRQNPWLGILAAHTILKIEEEFQSQISRSPESQNEDIGEYSDILRDKLIPFLESSIPMHPDVKALLVWRKTVSELPTSTPIESYSFPFPPMLWISFRRIYAYSTRYAQLIPVNSLTDCIIDKPLDDSPWTAWSHLNRYPEKFAETEIVSVPNSIGKALSKIKQKVFSVKNFPIPQNQSMPLSFQSDEPVNISTDQKALQEISVLQTAQDIVNDYVDAGKIEEMPEVYSFNAADQIGQMLENVDAEAVSSAGNFPLSRVENILENLKVQGRFITDGDSSSFEKSEVNQPKPVSQTQQGQAIINFAINSKSPKVNDFDQTGTPDTENSSVKIENIFNHLHAGAVRLWTSVNGADSAAKFSSAEKNVANNYAAEIETLAQRILSQADFIVNTNQFHHIVKSNEAFRYLLLPQNLEPGNLENLTAELRQRQAVWEQVLANLSTGLSKLNDPFSDSFQKQFSVRRTMLEDRQNNLVSYLNIIREINIPAVSPENLNQIALLLSDITLFTSLFTYGSANDKNECVGKLSDLIGRIQKLISLNN